MQAYPKALKKQKKIIQPNSYESVLSINILRSSISNAVKFFLFSLFFQILNLILHLKQANKI